jgi:TatD DNase family protein
MFFVDSHCHLDYEPMVSDIKATISRAKEAGIGAFLTICTDLSKMTLLKTIAEGHSSVFATVGVHPHEAEKTLSPQELLDTLRREAQHPKVVGFGETGLDYYYGHSPKEEQKFSFQAHIEAALEYDLPLIVHTRDAEEDTIHLLKTIGKGKARGVMHCFSGSSWLRDQALELGFYVSASGILTFKKAEDLRVIFKDVPLDRLLLETDAPYLAPEPYRGKSNEPAFLIETAKKLAELKGVSLDEIKTQTTRNFLTLFSKVNLPCA